MQNELFILLVFVIGISFYLNLCYKKYMYRKEMLRVLTLLLEQTNKAVALSYIQSQLNRALDIEKENAKLLKIILPINVVFIGTCSIAMTSKFFIIFLILISVYMFAFIFDKKKNILFCENLKYLKSC